MPLFIVCKWLANNHFYFWIKNVRITLANDRKIKPIPLLTSRRHYDLALPNHLEKNDWRAAFFDGRLAASGKGDSGGVDGRIRRFYNAR